MFGKAPAVYFRGAIVNPKAAQVSKDTHNNCLARHTLASEYLNAAIDHTP
jgi:hypothetical protein